MPKKVTKELERLRYPEDLSPERNDYMSFTHSPYRVNDALYGRSGSRVRYQPRAKRVQLYMPNSTPATPNDQGWNAQTFPGDRGQLSKQLLAFAGGGDNFVADTGRFPGLQRTSNGFEIAQQNALDFIAQQLQSDAATALQLAKGQVYNPNVESMYKMPSLRSFRFDFDFIPKNRKETKSVDAIIREFKYWSSPGRDDKGKFLQVPDIWDIAYYEAGGGKFKRMNKFKFCVLESVRVTENPKSNYHITIDDPDGAAPVHTSMSLLFSETDIIVRQDYVAAYKEGYRRGY